MKKGFCLNKHSFVSKRRGAIKVQLPVVYLFILYNRFILNKNHSLLAAPFSRFLFWIFSFTCSESHKGHTVPDIYSGLATWPRDQLGSAFSYVFGQDFISDAEMLTLSTSICSHIWHVYQDTCKYSFYTSTFSKDLSIAANSHCWTLNCLVSSVQQVNTYKTNQISKTIGGVEPWYLPQNIFLLTDNILARLLRRLCLSYYHFSFTYALPRSYQLVGFIHILPC